MAFPSPAGDYKQSRLALDDLIVHPEATYFVRNRGLSMEPTFHKGDVLIVDRAIVPLDGRAVVVIYHEKFYVRRMVTVDNQVILKADNPAFVDIVAGPGDIEVWGVVTYAIHKMR
ncbi:MAG TPA: S24 family peptidase [Ktedonobacteraceae bacterium]|nr:S24 family peptidase [Ktedonobacteraceae bacterium]